MSDSNDTPAGASGSDKPKPDKSKSGKSRQDKPKRRPRGLAAIAIIVAIIAVLLAAWSTWQVTRARSAGQAARSQAASQLHGLQAQLATGKQQAAARGHRLDALESNLHDLRAQVTNLRAAVKGQGLRTSNLEAALARLKGRQQSARDALLLDNAALLLRTGQQRFELFHDSDGAVRAYTQAIAVLGKVQNPAYAPVRTSAITERDALAAAAPPSRQAALDALSKLRDKVDTLPLAKPAGASSGQATEQGWWSRFVDSFRGIVRIAHVGSREGTPRVAGRFARQMLAVDLVQAQEALLAFDHAAFHASVQRAAKDLAHHFDTHADAVHTATARLAKLLARPAPGKPPQLGGALAQLRSLRANQLPTQPARTTTAPTPAPASSSAGAGR